MKITSPGTSSPLTQPRHFRRNVGRLVQLTLSDGSQATGRVVAAGPAELTIQPEASGSKGRPGATPDPRTIPYVDIAKAGVQVEFNRTDDADEADDASDELYDDQED